MCVYVSGVRRCIGGEHSWAGAVVNVGSRYAAEVRLAAGDNRRAGKVLLPGDHYSIRRVLLLGSDLPKQVASSPFSRGEV